MGGTNCVAITGETKISLSRSGDMHTEDLKEGWWEVYITREQIYEKKIICE